jgi:hypothetical protein
MFMDRIEKIELAKIAELFSNGVGLEVEKYHTTLERICVEAVRSKAIPPIKGGITKGKLKWRGICITQDAFGQVYVTQRGVRISPKLKMFTDEITEEL